jgi:hypothetical protein
MALAVACGALGTGRFGRDRLETMRLRRELLHDLKRQREAEGELLYD